MTNSSTKKDHLLTVAKKIAETLVAKVDAKYNITSNRINKLEAQITNLEKLVNYQTMRINTLSEQLRETTELNRTIVMLLEEQLSGTATTTFVDQSQQDDEVNEVVEQKKYLN